MNLIGSGNGYIHLRVYVEFAQHMIASTLTLHAIIALKYCSKIIRFVWIPVRIVRQHFVYHVRVDRATAQNWPTLWTTHSAEKRHLTFPIVQLQLEYDLIGKFSINEWTTMNIRSILGWNQCDMFLSFSNWKRIRSISGLPIQFMIKFKMIVKKNLKAIRFDCWKLIH